MLWWKMHHLFLGIPTDTLALAPYTPKVTEAQELWLRTTFMYIPGRSFGGFPISAVLSQYRRLCNQRLPNIGGYTVGCLVASDLDTCEEEMAAGGYWNKRRAGSGLPNNRDGLIARLNPQRQFGADVVSRCSYALNNGGEALSGCIRNAVNILLRELAKGAGRNPEDIVRIVMVGNSCMHHLFLGIPTDTLALAPYTPKVTEAQELMAIQYDIHVHPRAQLWWLPNIGGFVGADTVGCLVASDLDACEEMTLLVDIGTNGELVLGNRDGLITCSTAAGPAFEGAKITCGMRGSKGAIDHVTVKDGETICHVIGETEAVGICGSGLLDGAACLLKLGKIDETGRLEKEYHFTDRVFLNQKDIRELQLAKAAIAAGIRSLCEKKGIKVSDISRVLIAGAFGNYLDPASACAIGMIPPELQTRITSIGNAAGEGACMVAVNREQFERSRILAQKAEFVELALDMGFQEIYVEEMEFPGESEHE